MPSGAPELRPLSITERGISTLYGSIPSSFMLIFLRILFTILSGPDLSFWHFIRYITGFDAGLGIHIDIIDTYYVPFMLANGAYAVFYFSFSRSLGHMVVYAHIVDARTGRRMRNWQKAVRSVLQIANGYIRFLRILDILSVMIVLIDRERRRSLYDLISGTMVVVGSPVEEEPETATESVWSKALGWLTGRDGATERR